MSIDYDCIDCGITGAIFTHGRAAGGHQNGTEVARPNERYDGNAHDRGSAIEYSWRAEGAHSSKRDGRNGHIGRTFIDAVVADHAFAAIATDESDRRIVVGEQRSIDAFHDQSH